MYNCFSGHNCMNLYCCNDLGQKLFPTAFCSENTGHWWRSCFCPYETSQFWEPVLHGQTPNPDCW